MSISVVIPTYGDSRWQDLAWSRAYPSVAQQDCDTVVHHEPDMTIGPARNQAAVEAAGDWLVFLDADDELHADFVLGMRKAKPFSFSRHILFTPAIQYVRHGRPQDPIFWPEQDLRDANWLPVGTMINQALFWKLGGFRDLPHGLEDWDLWSRAHREGATVTKVPRSIYVAHHNPRSKHHLFRRQRKAYKTAYEAIRKANWPELYPEQVPR